MKKILKFFTPQQEQNLLEKQKIIAFIVISSVLFIIISLLFTQTFIYSKNGSGFYLFPIAAFFIIINLFLLKNFGLKTAGNIFSFGLLLFQVIALNILKVDDSVILKYTQGFYLALTIIVISAMFASRKILILNSALFLISTTRVYLFGIEHSPEEYDTITPGFINYTATLIIITLILYFINKFTENAINASNNDAKIKDKQNKALLKMVAGIKESSEQIFKASEQLSSSSQQISSNANEQAATTEEVASSMEQMLAMINSNTQNAETTGLSSEKSANEMKESNEIFIQTIKSVAEISKKITIISEIADKTDILSINAAIEAARAGEAGKGFAVVAHEIRKLADKTKSASEEINKLSKNGQNISKIAGEKLKNAIPEIIKSAELVNNIVSAGKEQQSGVTNINISVQQLTEITNENSASAEEMSASAEELSAQAEQLKELISVFKIGDLEHE